MFWLLAALAACSRTSEPVPRPLRIDVHTHVSPTAWRRALELFDRAGIRVGVNMSGGPPGPALARSAEVQRASGGRLRFFCNLDFRGVADPDWGARATLGLERCRQQGALGWKIPKSLGLGVVTPEGLLAVDDPRLDPAFEAAGRLGLPVLIHVADPKAFFEPATPANERWDELRVHPQWSFADPRFPRWNELLEALDRRIGRHPGTTFIGAHFGNAAEEPDRVASMLARHPNYLVDTAARLPEMGRHSPARMRRLFVRFQDRILFGTDLGVGDDDLMLGSTDDRPVTEAAITRFFRAHDRYFETALRRIEHPTPIQGRWKIDAIDLPHEVLEKVYWRNASRLLGITLETRDPGTRD